MPLSTAEKSRLEHSEQILQQINTLVIPQLTKLWRFVDADRPGREYLTVVETNHKSLTSSLSSRLTREFRWPDCNRSRDCGTRHARQDALASDQHTIEFHRNNIRRMLSLERRVNVRVHVTSIR